VTSSSDQLFQKRKAKKKEDLVRQNATLQECERVLIVCEGLKAEPLYLNALVSDLGLTTAEVKVCGECGSAPTSVFMHGVKKFEEDADFDQLFFVFDRDSHSDYDAALQKIDGFKKRRNLKDN